MKFYKYSVFGYRALSKRYLCYPYETQEFKKSRSISFLPKEVQKDILKSKIGKQNINYELRLKGKHTLPLGRKIKFTNKLRSRKR